MKIKRILLHNVGLKSVALVLALVTWLYVGEATKEDSEQTVLQKLLSTTPYISKKLYIQPVFIGNIPEGYRFLKEGVKVTPESIVVMGPAKLLSDKEKIYTKPIDLSEHTKSKMIDTTLESISRSVKFQRIKVQVYLSVEKLKDEEGT